MRTTAPKAAIKYSLRLRIIVRATIIHSLTLLAIVLFAATTVSEVTAKYIREGHVHIFQYKEIPSYVSIFRIHGPCPVRRNRQARHACFPSARASTNHYAQAPEHDCNRFYPVFRYRKKPLTKSTNLAGNSFFAEPENNQLSECQRPDFTAISECRISASASKTCRYFSSQPMTLTSRTGPTSP